MPPRAPPRPARPPRPAGAPPGAFPPPPGAQGLGKGAVLGALEAAGVLSALPPDDAPPPAPHCPQHINSTTSVTTDNILIQLPHPSAANVHSQEGLAVADHEMQSGHQWGLTGSSACSVAKQLRDDDMVVCVLTHGSVSCSDRWCASQTCCWLVCICSSIAKQGCQGVLLVAALP